MTDKSITPADLAALPSVEELEAALAAALARKRAGEADKRVAQTTAWAELTADPGNWEWRATPERRSPSFSDPQVERLRVECRVLPKALEAWQASGPSTLSTDSQSGRWLGMSYYRTDEGILMHFGGGHVVLKSPCLCSDAQWADLAQGIVPLKWQRVGNW